jgi:hypothetical protein
MFFPTNGHGADALVTDLAQIAAIKIPSVLEFVLGEWALDTALGFPWQSIWAQKRPNVPQIQALFRKAILAITVAGKLLVAAVTDLSVAYNPQTRDFSYQLAVTLVNGQQVSVP